MKQTQLLFAMALFFASFLFTQQASATIWRVNNKSNYDGNTLWGDNFGGTPSYPVFPQIDDALKAGSNTLVAAGDTLYVEASSIPYAEADVSRKLIIIGSGYFLSQNTHVSSITDSSSIVEVNFNVGSEGSQLIGMSIIHSYPYDVNLNTNNLTVKRCWLADRINIGSGLTDIFILENFFTNTNDANAIFLDYPYTYPIDLIFNNNVCKKTLVWGGSILQCDNNVFDGPANTLNLQFTTTDFKNNILKSLNATTNINNGTNENVSYNIGTSSSQFGTAKNNVVVPNINSLFASSTTPDGMYQIASGSAASNSGSDGTDRGAFGGAAFTDRYTLSGLAAIPVIYSVSTTGATATALPVTIGARTIK